MAGLDTIVQEIQGLAQNEANHVLTAAKNEAAAILEESRAQAEQRRVKMLAEAEAEAKTVVERGVSGHRIWRRDEVLKLKQGLSADIIARAKQAVIDLPDEAYFAILKTWAGETDSAGQVTVRLNARDLARGTEGFLAAFPKAAQAVLSEEPADISGGFLADCGGVTVNCSIDAMFDLFADEIHRTIQRILFT